MKRKIISLIIAATIVMGLTACGGNSDSKSKETTGTTDTQKEADSVEIIDVKTIDVDEGVQEKSSKDTLIIAMPTDPGSVDMHYSTAYDYVQPFVMSRLMCQEYEDDGSIMPVINSESLAESYEYSDDNLQLTFKLRENVKFQNGNILTAEDVIYSIKLCSDQSYFDMVDFDNIKAADDLTVEVPLLRVDANALYNIAVMIPVYNKQHCEEVGDEAEFMSTSAIGTGPYKIAEWISGDYLSLEANKDYFAGTPTIPNITIRFMSDASVAFMEMQNGGVDIIQSPNWSDVEEVLNGNVSGISVWEEASSLALQLGMNCSGKLSDLKLRQCIAFAVDKESLVEGGYQGSGENTYSVVSKSLPGTKDYSDNWPYDYNPEKASELLEEAGYEPGELVLTCIVGAGDSLRTATAEIMGGYLEAIGITLNIKEVDIATYATIIQNNPGEWDFFFRNYSSGLANAPSAHNFFNQNVGRDCHIAEQDTSEKMLSLAGKMGETLDEEAKNEIFGELQDYYLNECLYTYPILQAKTYTLVNSELSNISKCGQIYWNLHKGYFN